MSVQSADVAFRAAIRSMSAPLLSPLGTSTYDMDCMIGQVAKNWAVFGRMPLENHVLLHAYGLGHLLHTCTSFGYALAVQRFHRARALIHGFGTADKDVLRHLAFDRSGRRRPLLSIAAALAEVDEEDPLSPDEAVHFRAMWFRHFAASAYLTDRINVEALGIGDGRVLRGLAEGLLIADAFDLGAKARCWEHVTDGEPLALHGAALIEGLPVVRYKGVETVPLDSRALMEAYLGLGEILLRLEGLREPATPLVRAFLKHRSYAVVRMGLFCLGVETLPYNMLVFAPELLLLMEKALNPPLPPIYDPAGEAVGPYEIDPMMRFTQLAQAAAKVGRPLRYLRLDAERIRERAAEISDATSVGESGVAALAHRASSEADYRRRTSLDWYEAIQGVAARSVFREGTTTLLEYLCCSVLSKSPDPVRIAMTVPPCLLDESQQINANGILHRPDVLTSFLHENIRTFSLADLLTAEDEVRPLPFGVTAATIADHWDIMRPGQFEAYIAGALGAPAAS